jgi:phage tail tape-measure protein
MARNELQPAEVAEKICMTEQAITALESLVSRGLLSEKDAKVLIEHMINSLLNLVKESKAQRRRTPHDLSLLR